MSKTVELICATLRDERPPWPLDSQPETLSGFVTGCVSHGVEVLLSHRAQALDWPVQVREALHRESLGWAIWEERHRQILSDALAALAAENIRPLLFKGTSLAYASYPQPHFRPRSDTDIMVAPALRQRAAEMLQPLGFQRVGSIASEFVSYETSLVRQEGGIQHTLDLHWRIHYSQLQAALFPYERLYERGQALPMLCEHARGLSPIDAVLVNCLHRANDLRLPQWAGTERSFGRERLIRIYDLHLLLQSMDRRELEDLARAATAAGIGSLCAEAILLAIHHFHTAVPAGLPKALSGARARECVSRYHQAPVWRQKLTDLFAIKDLRQRCAFVLEHMTPPAEYMRTRYPDTKAPLAWLHARRLLERPLRSASR